jgi:hypothetical protein
MTDSFVLNPIASKTILLLAIGLLFIAILILELKRPKKFLIIGIASVLLMMVSLAAIVLRPSVKTIQSQSFGLLTENYDPEKIDSLQKKKSIQLVALPGVTPFEKSTSLQSINHIENLSGRLAYIAGNGIAPQFHDLLGNHEFEFIPAEYPDGILTLNLPHEVFANRECQINGFYNSQSPVKIILENSAGKEDSIQLKGNGTNKFTLHFTPKQSGNFLYALAFEENGERKTEVLPISVKPHQSFRLLFLQNFPTFETQYLKKFLGKENQVQIRYQLSKEAYRHEAINTENKKINRINQETLNDFDLLIIDSDALEKLGSSEISDLRLAIKNGLGLLVLFNQSPETLRITKSFLPVRFTKYASDSAHVTLQKKVALQAWPLSPDVNPSLHSIIKNKNRTLAAYSHRGFGKIAFQLLQETYHLVLDGDTTSYSRIWSELIEKTSRKQNADFAISIKNKFPIYEDEPIDLEMISSGEMPSLLHDSTRVSIEEDLYIDNIWRTRIWANEPGWHSISTGQDSTKEFFYVSKKNDWKTVAAAKSINATTLSSSENQIRRGETEFLEPIDPIWFYLMFIVSAGMLWLLPKL